MAFLKIKTLGVFFLLFSVVSFATLFAMKCVLWTMFKWGGVAAIFLAVFLTSSYILAFFVASKKWIWLKYYISQVALKWIWVLSFMQLGFLGGLYHIFPQYFPALVAEFFFA